MRGFTHLHVHTEYSLLDGAGRIADMVRAAAKQQMHSLAITDHGVMYGVVDFYKECRRQQVHPILGCEVYVAPRSLTQKDNKLDREYGHLVLLARDMDGYKNLMKLVSLGFTQGFYYKPRIDYDVLEQYAKGLVGLSACIQGDIPRLLAQGQNTQALALAQRLQGMLGDENFYIEVQDHGIPEQRRLNPLLVELAERAGIGLVASNDVHYVAPEDAEAQDVLLCIQTGKRVEDAERMRLYPQEFYLKSPEQMAGVFGHLPQALDNTNDIARRCNVELEFGKLHLPGFTPPEGKTGEAYLRELCESGVRRKLQPVTDEIRRRLERELNTICDMGYVEYFLIVWDFIRYARSKDIAVGPGRGSAAGSLVAFALDITNVNPLRYDLIFERFLNPERISMPDIDIDFCYERRQEVIDYVTQKYGADKVAQIITFGTMAAKGSIRDVGRALGLPYGDVDRIAKLVPMELGMTLEKALEKTPELRAAVAADPQLAHLMEMARKLEGLARHASTHAAGVVISQLPVTEYVPIQTNDQGVMTQFPMGTLEELGLLKMDFLGLRTLTVIRDAVDMLAQRGVTVDMDTLGFDDPAVYEMIGRGETDGVFQLESAGMRNFMKELRPNCFEDIIAGVALFRPGPMDQIPRYVQCKHDPSQITYLHPAMEEVTQVTYGCIVYQEQVMQLVRKLAGYSMGRSDLVRRAMSKKKQDVMTREREIFLHGQRDAAGNVEVEGAVARGVDERTANTIFDQMMDFASYAFNKSHAAAYAVLAYQTGYLKCYHPKEFFTALLNSFMGSADKVSGYIQVCRQQGIQLLPPDIAASAVRFSPEEGGIRFGLAAVRNVGVGVAQNIVAVRQESPFAGYGDFLRRMAGDKHCNKRAVESLIFAGALDSLGETRATLAQNMERIMDGIAGEGKRTLAGQLSLFEGMGGGQGNGGMRQPGLELARVPEMDEAMRLGREKEMTGVYFSGHPLEKYRGRLESIGKGIRYILDNGRAELPDHLQDGAIVKAGGILTSVRRKTTKNNQTMAYARLEDLYAGMELVIFPRVLESNADLVRQEGLVAVQGKLSLRDDADPQILAECFKALDVPGHARGGVWVRLHARSQSQVLQAVREVATAYPGDVPLKLYYESTRESETLPRNLWVTASEALIAALSGVVGADNVKVVSSVR